MPYRLRHLLQLSLQKKQANKLVAISIKYKVKKENKAQWIS
jgi:hypothetical protein